MTSRHRLHRFGAVLTATVTALATVTVLSAEAAPALLSQGKPATASSAENADTSASAAVDGNPNTRWSSAFADPQWLQVDLGAPAAIDRVTLTWETAAARAFQIQVSDDGSTWTTIHSATDATGGTQDLTVSGSGRYVRMYGTARTTAYGYSLWEFQVYGDSGTAVCGTTNAAQGKTATASSIENAGTPASAAVDGNPATRWASAFSDPQWLRVDLGARQDICRVGLSWEAAYATAFQIQVSDDGAAWTTIHSTTTGAGGDQTLDVTGSGRYLRVLGTQRATSWGYSLWELSVHTTGGTGDVPVTDPFNPDFGPNTFVYDPSTPQAEIQSRVDAIAAQMKTNQFGTERYAVLFKPGTYNVDVNLRFYTQVAGLGLLPGDVNINGHVRVEADWLQQGDDPNNLGNATQNFWRTAENMAVTIPSGQIERWAVSQAAPYRRMHLRGGVEMQLWNGYNGWASGGLIADSRIEMPVISGSQQQFLTRNSELVGGWSGSVWNMMFTGTTGAPAQNFPNPSHTVVAQTPTMREKPFLYIDDSGEYRVFVPALRTDSVGTSWSSGSPAGESISLSQFYVVRPGSPMSTVNAALAEGKHILFTPGVYSLSETLRVTNPNTVVLGLGLATLIPETGLPALTVADVDGVKLAGFLVDAGPVNSPVLIEIGPEGSSADHSANPTSLHDVFFRIGGAHAGKATVSLRVNSDDVIGDHMWLWRGDHGEGIGWDVNTAANGLVVNGDDVTMHGLFVEHYQEHNTIWNGERGKTFFYQNEIPYDPPNNTVWPGWASYKVADSVTDHLGVGMGVYCFFNVNPSVVAPRGFEVPDTPGVRFRSLVTVSLGGVGTISRVINDTGAPVNDQHFVEYLPAYP